MGKRIDKASKLISASPEVVYEAFSTQRRLQSWLPPKDMEGQVSGFDFKEDGGYRMRLIYTGAGHTPGKTTEHSDEVVVRFTRLIPNKRIEQLVTFNSDLEAFKGEMKMTWSFEKRESNTFVEVSCTDVPYGIRPQDHEVGLTSSLENLAEYVQN